MEHRPCRGRDSSDNAHGPFRKEPGLVGLWRFDDVENIATDSSENHSDGKLMGNAHFVEAELPKPGELVIPTVLWGMITNESGQPIPNTSVRLEQDGEKITQTQTDASGNYRIFIFHPVSGFDGFDTLGFDTLRTQPGGTQPKPQATQPKGLYDLSAVSGELGAWRLGIRLSAGEWIDD